MIQRMHALRVPLCFPTGLAAGAGSAFNELKIARDGRGRPVLRGSAIAGVLRSNFRRAKQMQLQQSGVDPSPASEQVDAQIAYFFGRAQEQDATDVASRLLVADAVLERSHNPHNSTTHRTHHLRNRHTGAVVDGGLFSLEATAPETRATLVLWLKDDADEDESKSQAFLQELVNLLNGACFFGGHRARGLGRAVLADDPLYGCYALDVADAYARWLDDYRNWREQSDVIPADYQPLSPTQTLEQDLCIDVQLRVPRGQDLCISDGEGLDYHREPQQVITASGERLWRLPGSTLRGLFRSWMTRLAALDKKPVADHVQRYETSPETMTGENLGRGFAYEAAELECPVYRLFGSTHQSGRIFIADGFATCSQASDGTAKEDPRLQVRRHVAIDAVTGGAMAGMLFDNTVLTSSTTEPLCFKVHIRIAEPEPQEVDWLVRTLRALDLGLLRVGSSCSSGRLELAAPPAASGRFCEQLEAIQPRNPATR